MKVIYTDLTEDVFKKQEFSNTIKCVATIGVFDGVHLGHKFIIQKVKEQAETLKIFSLVITFDIPPQIILNKHFLGCISNLKDKKKLIATLGIDYLLILKTSKKLLKLTAVEFLDGLSRYFFITKLIVGEGFSFGHNRSATISTLRSLAKKYKFDLEIIKRQKKDGRIISSTFIRKCIRKAAFKTVYKFLDRNYYLSGVVKRGSGLGKKIGFPTANIDFSNYVLPYNGVYIGLAYIKNKYYMAAINIGTKPTVSNEKKITVEAHIISFKKNILDEKIKIIFIKKIRREKKFFSILKLKNAISKDVSYIKKFLSHHKTLLNIAHLF
ncbi:MAG: bifunctional riboflavin kinase/FAD synthetase [Candidatus Omnitrophica bacterium]|nr:bifunctional riboflavin kinase/FAD synthetase [Candidatus Omnitrophota bacterium]